MASMGCKKFVFIVALIVCGACQQEPESQRERDSTALSVPVKLAWKDLVPDHIPFPQERYQPDPHAFDVEQITGAVVPELDGQRVKIGAFVVPLEGDHDSFSELLLVPYFGACIHVPPPPSNQIIYFASEQKKLRIKNFNLQMPVLATGTLFIDEMDHELAQVGYRMDIETLEEYKRID